MRQGTLFSGVNWLPSGREDAGRSELFTAPETVRVMTIQQPWAWAITQADKRVENRPYPDPWRSGLFHPVLIHAGKSESFYTPESKAVIEKGGRYERPAWIDLAKGAVVGVTTIRKVCLPKDLPEAWMSRYVETNWCVCLGDVVALERPIEVSGRQGMWRMPWEALTEECRQAVRTVCGAREGHSAVGSGQ